MADDAGSASAEVAQDEISEPEGPTTWTKWSSKLIFEQFSETPQTAEQIYTGLIERYGQGVPGISTIKNALASRGEKNGGAKIRGKNGAVMWLTTAAGEAHYAAIAAAAAAAATSKGRKLKPTSKMMKPGMSKKESAADIKGAAQRRAAKMLEKPMTGFMLFGFSQRGIMKKHKVPIKEVVQAVGARLS